MYKHTIGHKTYLFKDLKTLLAKASPERSGDRLAGIAAESHEERAAAQLALSDVPLAKFLEELIIPYEKDEVTRLIIDSHDKEAFKPVSHLTVGDFRNWLLGNEVDTPVLQALSPGLTPEMAAAVSKIMSLQDLICRFQEMQGRNQVQKYHRPGRPLVRQAPAQPPHGRPEGNRREHPGRTFLRRGRRGHRDQSRDRQYRKCDSPFGDARFAQREVRHSRPVLRPCPRYDDDGGNKAQGARGPGLSIHRGNGGRQ